MLTNDFDYHLPLELIAQEPLEPRDHARLMVLRGDAPPVHHQVRELDDLLNPGDLLVLNHTRVFPARLLGRKHSGGAVEVLLIHPEDDDAHAWRALIRGRVAVGTLIAIDDVTVNVERVHDDGQRTVRFPIDCDAVALAERIGHIPLPPYIDRADCPDDRTRYQTVFAEVSGSVAAPTAGLHFTPELLARLRARGILFARVDLAIGPGTFKPVDCERIEDFHIHAERCVCPPETVAAINACRARGGRVIAIGTTVVRTLESAAEQPGGFSAYTGWTRIFLHPPRRLSVVDGLLTNFHLPRSSLLMLVSCLTGRERLLAAYRDAISAQYRFFSYGDAMLILP